MGLTVPKTLRVVTKTIISCAAHVAYNVDVGLRVHVCTLVY